MACGGERDKDRAWWEMSLRSWLPWFIYAGMAIVMTWPLVTNLGSRLGGTNQDILNVFWGNWWVPKALLSGQDPYTTDFLIYPIGFNLISFAFSPLLACLGYPLKLLFSSITAYNLLVWLVTIVCCVSMDQLVRYLTDNPWAALVAGTVFGFAPALAAHRAAHLNMATVAWLPWAALLLTRLMREAKVRDAVLLAVVALLAFLTRLQVGILAGLFCGVYFLGLAIVEGKRWSLLAFGRLALAIALALLLLIPLFLKIGQVLDQPDSGGAIRAPGYVQTDLLSFVTPMPQHPVFGSWTDDIYARNYTYTVSVYWVYLGIVPLGLAVYAGVGQPRRAFPWLVTGLCFFVLALGTHLRIGGHIYDNVRLPFGWAANLFAAIGSDRPDRFTLALAPALAVLVGLACDQVTRRGSGAGGALPALLVIVVTLFEYTTVPNALYRLPEQSDFYAQMAEDGEGYAVVDFPLTRPDSEVHRYWQTVHQKPIVGGWDHRVPDGALSFIAQNPFLAGWLGDTPSSHNLVDDLEALAREGVRYLIIHKDQLGGIPDAMQAVLLAVKPVYEDDAVYVLPTNVVAAGALNVAVTYENGASLVWPTVIVSDGVDGPALDVHTCWVPGEAGDNRYIGGKVQLYDPAGRLLDGEGHAFSEAPDGPKCQSWSLALGDSIPGGSFQVGITMLSSDGPLPTYMMTERVNFVDLGNGQRQPWLGTASDVAFDAPVELVGYRIQPGHNLLLVDTYWRGTACHRAGYGMTLQVLDPITGLPVTRSTSGLLPNLSWREDALVVDRRAVMVNDIAPGQYRLSLWIGLADTPGERIAAYRVPDGEQLPGGQVDLYPPVLVLPEGWRDMPAMEDDRVVITTKNGLSGTPQSIMTARIGDVVLLNGYHLERADLIPGEPFDLALYWQALDQALLRLDYRVFVHVIDAAGQLVAQHDGSPAAGQRPTYGWHTGDMVLDVHHVTWLVPDATGPVTIRIGIYDPNTVERLPVYNVDGIQLSDDQVVLGTFGVGTD